MKKLIALIVTLIAALVILYIYMPVISYGFWGFPVMLIFFAVIWIILNLPANASIQQSQQFIKRRQKWILIPSVLILILIGYAIIVPVVTSWALLRSSDYRDLIGKVEVGNNLSSHMAPISLEKIRVVDQSLATILGDKVLGAQPALGSQVYLGTFNIQKVGTELYWVAPLLHSGFFKWYKNMAGTNGYVMVNATNERDVKLVQEVKGKKVFVKYQSEAYFFYNLERYLYVNGFYNVGLTDYSFEIDDEGNPFWVVTIYKKKVGFYGEDATGVVVVDTQTGKIDKYSIADAPAWIDRIQPANFIEAQLNDWGEYVHGYWNFSNENKLQITENVSLVYGEDNKSYWYTGLTSVGADESTVGFILVNTRTKEAVWYKQGGATEYAAQNSAIGKVQEKRFKATLPIPYNISGIPTYVMTLKDDGGLVKMFAMVAIEDYTIVGVGNTLAETLMAYKNAYNMTGNKINLKNSAEKATKSSILTRISSDVKNGNSFYYFTIKDYNSIFIGSSQISNSLPISSVGDSVEISFDMDTQGIIDIGSFKNLTINKPKN